MSYGSGFNSVQFEVKATDCKLVSHGRSMSGAWANIVNSSAQIRNRPPSTAVSGPELFGITFPEVALRIQRLPGAKQCAKYKWQTFLDQQNLAIPDDAVI
jgi:hypothetical protein